MKEALVALEGSVPLTLMIFIGILLNHKGMDRLCRRVADLEILLRSEMRSIRDEFRSDGVPFIAKSR
jgi:hypothetical protein